MGLFSSWFGSKLEETPDTPKPKITRTTNFGDPWVTLETLGITRIDEWTRENMDGADHAPALGKLQTITVSPRNSAQFEVQGYYITAWHWFIFNVHDIKDLICTIDKKYILHYWERDVYDRSPEVEFVVVGDNLQDLGRKINEAGITHDGVKAILSRVGLLHILNSAPPTSAQVFNSYQSNSPNIQRVTPATEENDPTALKCPKCGSNVSVSTDGEISCKFCKSTFSLAIKENYLVAETRS